MSHRIWEIQYAGSPKVLWIGLKPAPEQLAIADRLGIQMSPDDTFAAVASAILERVADAIGCPPRVVSDRQRELADELEIDLTDSASSWSVFMRIQEAIQLSNLDAVRRMGLKPGGIVFKPDDPLEQRLKERSGERWESVAGQFPREFEVSNIREDGQVYFKGGSEQAPARYLEKRAAPEGTEQPDVRTDQPEVRYRQMPSQQHEQWKQDLFDHLDRKLSGCISCEFGEGRDSHAPTHRGRHREPSQQVLWTCERMHPHSYDLLRGAGFVVMEQQQSAPIGGRCRPDLTILDTHRQPLAFIEIVRSNRPSNSLRVAEELGIPLFTILSPHRRSLVPGLRPSRPWWDFDPSLPEDAKQQMYFTEQVADELMRRNGDGDSTWANLDMMLDDDGNLVFASFRGSPPDLAAPTFPRTGDLIVAELCSWDCDKAMEVLRREQLMDQQNAMVSMRETLEQDLGRILLGAIRGARDRTGRFVVPVGSEEVHVEMSLKPLNPHVSASDPIVLNLMAQVANAADKVRNSGMRSAFEAGLNGVAAGPLPVAGLASTPGEPPVLNGT